MNKSLIIKHLKDLNNYSEIDRILYTICFHGAPTINRYKPASLICFKNGRAFHLKYLWDKHKDTIKDLLPFEFKEVKRCEDGINVLFYWEDWLTRIVESKKNSEYLSSVGYGKQNTLEESLEKLRENFNHGCPNEIGVFLGYPLSDVIAFSSERKQECLCVGYRKVYSNIDRARKTFKLYDDARSYVLKSLESGVGPKSLLEN